MRMTRAGTFSLLIGCWLVLWCAAVMSRPLWPIDETRYVSVAWEMWARDGFLVPYLNGEPYSHKPPLLFWLIQSGWWLFGVNGWWPRLVPPLFALAGLFLTARLARLLWPEREGPSRSAPLILLGCLLYAVFSGVVMFDMPLLCFTLLALIGLLHAWRGAAGGWAVYGIGIGFGILTKGPVVLLHTLPVALLAPWWGGRPVSHGWTRWYTGVLFGLLIGVAIGLGWALPAAVAGGEAYADAILWGQTSGRLVQSFAHRQPWWWYFPFLPAICFPWALWPAFWRSAGHAEFREIGIRFCLAWMLPAFGVFCFVSGKQIYYLLPLLPAFALAAGRVMEKELPQRRDYLLPGGILALVGGVVAAAPWVSTAFKAPDWIRTISPLWGLTLLLIGLLPIVLAPRTANRGIFVLALSSIAAVVVATSGIGRAAAPDYDLQPVAHKIHQLQSAGETVAHAGKYHGQYQFLGRLGKPLDVIGSREAAAWLDDHPDGRVVVYVRSPQELADFRVDYAQDYAGKIVAIVAAASTARP